MGSKFWVLAASLSTMAGFACQKKSATDAAADAQQKPSDINGAVMAETLALQLSSTLDILPAKEEATALKLAELDDAKGKVRYRLREESMQTIQMASGIYCFLGQTGYVYEANKGPYVALINEAECFDESGGDEGGGEGGGEESSSSSNAVTYTRVVVDVTREEGKALQGKLWIDDKERPMYLRFTVAEGSSAENPVGIFRLDFSSADGGGFLETFRDPEGRVNLVLKEVSDRGDEGKGSTNGAARLTVENAQVTGGAFRAENSWKSEKHTQEQSYKVAFNDSHVFRSGSVNGEAEDACLSRDSYVKSAHRYNIYKADGSLYKLNSGFPIEFVGKSGNKVNGHASYHGIWAPQGELEGVTTVNRMAYTEEGPVATPYTLISAPGKLIEYTANKIELGKIKGMEINYHEMSNGPSNGPPKNLMATWDGSNFVKVAYVSWSEGGETREAASGTITLGETAHGHSFFVPSLQASIFIPKDASLSDSYEISFHSQRIVSGSDAVPSGNLVCFSDCPKMNPTAAELSSGAQMGPGPMGGGNSASPYIMTTGFNDQQSQAAMNVVTPIATYTWDATTHNIKMGSTAFAFPTLSSDGHVQLRTGALIPQASWDALTGKDDINPWSMDQKLDKFYRFESGNQSWSQFQGLIDDAGNAVAFDPPVTISYQHSQANDLNGAEESPFYGRMSRLEYGGPGQLWGFPSEKSPQGWYMPAYSLAVGTELGDGLVAVPMEVEQILEKEADTTNCGNMSLEDLPGLSDSPIEGFELGDVPADAVLVKYVNGESASE
jgi:hypothetical protein